MVDKKDGNEVHNLDHVDDRLYRRDLAGRKEKVNDTLRVRRLTMSKEWPTIPVARDKVQALASHPSFFKKFFLGSMAFAAMAFVVALLMFFSGGNTVSNSNIDINVLGNSFAAGGEELPLQVEVANHNTGNLELVDLFVEYEKGGDTKSGSGLVRDINSLGTVTAGKSTTKTIFLTLFGEEGTTKTIDFTLQYRLHGSNAIFIKKSSFAVTISSAPVALTIDAPKTSTPNQNVSITIHTKSNAKNTLVGMLLRVDYPSGFKLSKSTPEATALNNVWSLGDLAPGAERIITLNGTLYGQNGEDRAFHAYVGAASASDKTKIGVTYNSILQTIGLTKPFLAAHILINGSDAETVAVPSSGIVHVSIPYENNLTTRITDAEIALKFSGNVFDPLSIKSEQGFYDSSRQAILWSVGTGANQLASLEPTAHGMLDLTFNVVPLVSGGTSGLTRPSVKLSVSISGKQEDQGGVVSAITDSEQKTAVVSSDLGFSSNAYYRSGPFTNTGMLPPKAGEPTTYTITWSITNSANALTDGFASATLPPYVEWMGITSPSSEAIEYDPTTHLVRWKIGQVPANTGIGSKAKSVSFQIRFNPSTSQVGSIPKIVQEVTVSARDTFTSETITTTRPATSTILRNDTGYTNGGEEIVTN